MVEKLKYDWKRISKSEFGFYIGFCLLCAAGTLWFAFSVQTPDVREFALALAALMIVAAILYLRVGSRVARGEFVLPTKNDLQ